MLETGQVCQAVFYTGGTDEARFHAAEAVGVVVVKPDLEPLRAAVRRLSSRPPAPKR
jgi:hypothetical protein